MIIFKLPCWYSRGVRFYYRELPFVMIQYNFWLLPETDKKVRAEAARRELTRSDIIREALREYFERREPKNGRVDGMVSVVSIEEKK